MDNTATFEAYMLFRMTEEEHIANSDVPDWVNKSDNPEYERHLLTAYLRTF